MLIRQFLEWFTLASADDRVEAAEALCRAYLDGHLTGEAPRDIDAALTLLLDDSSPRIRQVLSHRFAEDARAPRHIIIALAHDQPEVAVPVLIRSPVLADADLIDCLAVGDVRAQVAIASRLSPSRAVAAALAEVGCVEAISALVKNENSDIAAVSFARMAERFGDDVQLRTLMLEREDLPLVIRHALVIRVSEHLIEMICRGQWMPRMRAERLLADARQSATVLLISAAAPDEVLELVDDMRVRGQLTPALLLRGLLSRDLHLFEAALAVLSEMPPARVSALLRERHGAGFAALYRRAKMPASLFATFEAAVRGVLREGTARQCGEEPRLSRSVIGEALLACAATTAAEGSSILGLLRRFEAEAAREEARRVSAAMLSEADVILWDDPKRLGSAVSDPSDGGPDQSMLAGSGEPVEVAIDFAAIEQELLNFAGGAALNPPAEDQGVEVVEAQGPVVEDIVAEAHDAIAEDREAPHQPFFAEIHDPNSPLHELSLISEATEDQARCEADLVLREEPQRLAA